TQRLIYADWLEEQGHPRAEFIRVQCEAAERERASAEDLRLVDDGGRDLHAQEQRLLRRHEKTWRAEDLGKRNINHQCTFRRGFVETVSMSAQTFLTRAEELFQRAPLRTVRLNEIRHVVAQLADCPWLAKVEVLDLSSRGNQIGDVGLER